MNIEQLFFELLQVAIGNRKGLSHIPSAKEWKELFELSKKQALVGIAFAGVTKLNVASDYGASLGIPEMVYLTWLGLMAKIQQRNKVVTEECVLLSKRLAHDGIMCCVLKGQSNLVNYPEDLRESRTPGDIDVLIRSMEEPDAIDLPVRYCITQCHLHDVPVGKICYHHMDMPWEGTIEVETHHRATWLNSPIRNWRLQRWLEESMPFGVCDADFTHWCQTPLCKKRGETFPIPPVSYNAIYQLLHIYKHLFEEGIGLRQLLDYYFVLRALHIEQGSLADRTESMAQWAEGMGIAVKSNKEIMHTLGRFGMKKFAGAVMYVLQTVLDPPKSSLLREDFEDWQKRWPWMICEPNEKEGKFLLNEIMQAGNFGKYDERIKHETPSIPLLRGKTGMQLWHAIEKTKHNLRLLTHYPEEVLWEPFFRLYHWIWRRFELWRW